MHGNEAAKVLPEKYPRILFHKLHGQIERIIYILPIDKIGNNRYNKINMSDRGKYDNGVCGMNIAPCLQAYA